MVLVRQGELDPHLVDEILAGNPEALGSHESHARARAVVEPLFLQAQREATGRYGQLVGTGLTLAAVTPLIKGGIVYLLAAGEVPGGGSAAVVFRYEGPEP